MKKISISAVAFVVLSIVALNAAAQDRVLAQANISFNFDMQGQTFEAGKYELRQVGAQVIRLQRVDNRSGVTLMSRQPIVESDTMNLTFHNYGNRYFLETIAAPSYHIELQKSKSEKEAEATGLNPKTMTLAVK